MRFRKWVLRSGKLTGLGVVQIVDEDGNVLSVSAPMADEEIRSSLKSLRGVPEFDFTTDELAQLYDERGEPIVWNQ